MSNKLKIRVREANGVTKKSPTLTPEEISAIESACQKHGMKCKASTDSTFVVIRHNGEEIYVEPADAYGNGLTISIGVWVYGGMDENSWATPDIKLNSHYASYEDSDITKIISYIMDKVYELLESREKTRTCVHYIVR